MTILWFRLDLRLADNPALDAAVQRGLPIVPVYIWAPEEEGAWPPGAASRWWLHQSLLSLDSRLRQKGSRLILRGGPTLKTLQEIIAQTGATAVYWNRRYEPSVIQRDTLLKEALRGAGITVKTFNAALLREPWTVQNLSGKPFRVFTPFWKSCARLAEPALVHPEPGKIPPPANWPKTLPVQGLHLEPKIDWTAGLRAAWRPGEKGATDALNSFQIQSYDQARNFPALRGSSRLSPHLHFGEISPRQVWRALRENPAREKYFAELGWREFAYHLLYHFPHTPEQPFRPEFARFPWRSDPARLKAWQRGETGFPIVDAGMRELWATGWMHNRVRMIAASFLVKDLLVPWQEGARWFWDTLVDADLASNSLGWQWSAGCGADAAPFFRIFNPVTQAEKFDPDGAYQRQWLPKDYSSPPMVDHNQARKTALELLAAIRP